MSGPFGSSQWMYNTGGGAFYPYEIEQSLRINNDDSAYLSRTPASAGNRKTWTWSGWVKRSNFGQNFLFSTGADSSNKLQVSFENYTSENLAIEAKSGGSTQALLVTNAAFRDASAWYHIVITLDTTQATSSDRLKIYVNGQQQTSFYSSTYPSLNADLELNKAIEHNIGKRTYASNYFDGYLAEVNFIDGQALDPTSFGEFKSGVWIPKQYGGTYGTNGFYLDFADGGALGDDESGNSNDWTSNNLVATDVMLDSPTNNFATWNAIKKSSTTTMSEGNLNFTGGSSAYFEACVSTIAMSVNAYYAEFIAPSAVTMIGIVSSDWNIPTGEDKFWDDSTGYGYYGFNGGKYTDNNYAYGSTFGSGDIIGVSYDADNGDLEFFKNGVSQGVAETGLTGEYVFVVATDNADTVQANFGQDSSFAGNKVAQGNVDANGRGDFYYEPPAGYLALCTANLPEPAIL